MIGKTRNGGAGLWLWLAVSMALAASAGRAEAGYYQAPGYSGPQPHYSHGRYHGHTRYNGYVYTGQRTHFMRGNGVPVGYGLVPPGHGESYEPRCKAYRKAHWVEPDRWAYQRVRYCK